MYIHISGLLRDVADAPELSEEHIRRPSLSLWFGLTLKGALCA